MNIQDLKRYKYIFATTIALFLIFLPLVLSIDFYQNDDLVYYSNVNRFLHGDLTLSSEVAPTFYVQGLLGLAFVKFFSFDRLPILTFIISCLNFGTLSIISYRFFKQDVWKSILIGLLLFFNPISFYSMLGFMGEAYLLFFALISLYFYYSFFENKKITQFIFANLFWILSFFVKQWAIVIPSAFVLQKFFQRKWNEMVPQLFILILVVSYYFFVFPRTNEMKEVKFFRLDFFIADNYIFISAYVLAIYLLVFAFPFVFSFIYEQARQLFNKKDKTQFSFLVVFSPLLAIFLEVAFRRTGYVFQTFPYYENIFMSTGFLPQIYVFGTEGVHPDGAYTALIEFLGWIGLICLSMLLPLLFLTKKIKRSFLSFEVFAILVGLILIIGTPIIFDRYLLIFIPIAIFFFIKLNDYKVNIYAVSLFLFAQALISIDFGIEFVNRQKLIEGVIESMDVKSGIDYDEMLIGRYLPDVSKGEPAHPTYLIKYSQNVNHAKEEVIHEMQSKGIFTHSEISIIKQKPSE